MKNLRTLIVALLLISTLGYTIATVSPVLAGPPNPDVPCEGHVCWLANSCLYADLTSPYYHCTNWCYSGGRWKCLGSSSCQSTC